MSHGKNPDSPVSTPHKRQDLDSCSSRPMAPDPFSLISCFWPCPQPSTPTAELVVLVSMVRVYQRFPYWFPRSQATKGEFKAMQSMSAWREGGEEAHCLQTCGHPQIRRGKDETGIP